MDKSILECIISIENRGNNDDNDNHQYSYPFFLIIMLIIMMIITIVVVITVLVVILGVYEICCNTLDTAHLRFTLHFTQ